MIEKSVLLGKKEKIEFFVPSLGDSILLRPLTYAECLDIKTNACKGTTLGGNANKNGKLTDGLKLDMNLEVITKADGDSQIKAVALGLGWTETEVKQITPASAVEEIAAEVFRISGMESPRLKEIEKFRKDKEGNDDIPAGPTGV